MDTLAPHQDRLTDAGDLASWQAFGLSYYEPIRRAFLILHVPEEDSYDFTHTFLLKAAEKNFLESYCEFQAKELEVGRKAKFRNYLYRSLQNHVLDHFRRRTLRERGRVCDQSGVDMLECVPETTLDPDAIYSLDVLHQALQALRRHCERTGKPHLWMFFEESYLANEFRGRRGKTRAELIGAFPGADPRFLDNSLTTAKRAFRRLVQEVVPRGLRDGTTPSARFEEWMLILRNAHASQFNLLHLAYRVSPLLAKDASQVDSVSLLVGGFGGVDDEIQLGCYEEPYTDLDCDELSIFLSFRLELPLTEMLDGSELQRFIPSSNALWLGSRGFFQERIEEAELQHPRPRALCLLTLIEPSPAEGEALESTDLVGLLARLKSMAKQLRRRPDHSLPEVYSQLLYTTVNVLALVRCGTELHSIGQESLARNVRWFLRQSWLDDRLRPLLLAGLTRLEGPSESA